MSMEDGNGGGSPRGDDARGSSITLIARWFLPLLALLGLALLWQVLPVSDWVERQLTPRIERSGAWGYLAFVAVYVAGVVLMAPGTILTLAGGFLFGPVVGGVLALGSATIGASIAFEIARRVARESVRRRAEADRRFRVIDRAVARRGAWVVLLLRLTPFAPFNVLNYALGLTGVRFVSFVLASLIGMVPGTAVIAFIGASAGEWGPGDLGPVWWAVLAVLALLVAAVLAAFARRELARETAEDAANTASASASASEPNRDPDTRPPPDQSSHPRSVSR